MSLQRDTGWFYLSFSSRHDLTPVYSEAEISNGRIAIERNLSTELKNEPNVSQRTRGSSRWSAELSACSCSSFIDRNDAVCHYSDSYIVENIFFHCLSNSLNMRTLVTNQRGSFPSFSRTVCAIVSQPRIWEIHHYLSARTSDTQACDNIALALLSGHRRQYLTRFLIKFAVPTIMNTAFHHAETLPEDGASLSPLPVIEECSQKTMQALRDQYRVWGVHMQSNIVYSVNCNDCGQTYVGKTDRQYDAWRSTVHPQLRVSHPAISNLSQQPRNQHPRNQHPHLTTKKICSSPKAIAKASKTPATMNANDSDSDKDKVILSALCKHEKDTGHHINWKDFRVVWRDEYPYRLLVKESLVIQAYKPKLNRTTHSVPLVVFPDGLTTDMLPDPNGWTNVFSQFSLSPFSCLSVPICSNFNSLCVRLSN